MGALKPQCVLLTAMLSSFTSLLVQFTFDSLSFEKSLTETHINYGLFSVASRNAHCDPTFLKHALDDAPHADYESDCGVACRELLWYTDVGKVQVGYFYNEVDHTQYIS